MPWFPKEEFEALRSQIVISKGAVGREGFWLLASLEREGLFRGSGYFYLPLNGYFHLLGIKGYCVKMGAPPKPLHLLTLADSGR